MAFLFFLYNHDKIILKFYELDFEEEVETVLPTNITFNLNASIDLGVLKDVGVSMYS